MIENQEIPDVLSENSASGIAADFYGINRNEDSVSEHVEGVISKNQTTADEAMAILYLLLKNATDYEVYEYKVCNKAGSVEKLGLASDILKLVPFDAQETRNGPTGPKPNSWFVWLLLLITGLILVAMPILATIYLFVKLFQFLANWGLKLLASFAESAKQALENAVKIIILVLACIILAFKIITMTISFLIIVGLLFMFALFFQLNYSWTLWTIEIKDPSSSDDRITIEIIIEWVYVDFIDLELPYISRSASKNGEIGYYEKQPVMLGNSYYSENTDIEVSDLKNYTNEDNSSEPPESITDEELSSFITGMDLSLTIFTILFGILGIASDINEKWGKITLGILILSAVLLGIGILLPLVSLHQELITSDKIFLLGGIILGMIIAGIIMRGFMKIGYHEVKDKIKATANLAAVILGLICLVINIIFRPLIIPEGLIWQFISFCILTFMPFVLTGILIGLTVSDKSNINTASNALIIIGVLLFVIFLVCLILLAIYILIITCIFIIIIILIRGIFGIFSS